MTNLPPPFIGFVKYSPLSNGTCCLNLHTLYLESGWSLKCASKLRLSTYFLAYSSDGNFDFGTIID